MQFLASGGMDKTVRIWDPASGKPSGDALRGHTAPVTCLAWEPMHRNSKCNRVASSSKDGTVRVWDVILRRLVFGLSQHTMPVMAVKWGGEGVIYTASRDKTIKLWDDGNVSTK